LNGPDGDMCGSWSPSDHPHLTDFNCVKTSEQDAIYNCIAWAAGDATRWWWPFPYRGVSYWPRGVPRKETIDAFIAAYATVGFHECGDGTMESGIEKIVIFAKTTRGILIPTHAARQLDSGEWTSKMGPLEDIRHTTADAPRGPLYGEPVCYLARLRE
jgi:hypothetical protein